MINMINIFNLSSIFLIFGIIIIVLKPNLLFVLFALEIILLGINLNLILGSLILDDALGKYMSLILFSCAALDTSVGLIIVLNYYNYHNVKISHPIKA